jgi:hypothetical protein
MGDMNQARRGLPGGFRRPPADLAGPSYPARPVAGLVPLSPAPAARPGPNRAAPREPATGRKPAVVRDPERPVTSGLGPGRRRGRARVPGLGVAALILLVAAGVAVATVRPHLSGRPGVAPAAAPGAGQAALRRQAAAWISQQVSRSVIVACDPLMCSVLVAQGVPAANLLELGSTTADPRQAEVVVVTPAVRDRFGSRLDRVYAPSVMAAFGSGAAQVSVRVVAPVGAAAYLTALHQDVASRKAAGLQLLANRRIGVTARARTQLTAGEIDSRLLIMLPALAAAHPVQVLSFGDRGPEASPGIPWCSADLSGSGRAAGMTDASYVRWLVGFVRAQLAPFAGSTTILRRGGQSTVRVAFSAPSPVGLLTPK